MESFAIGGDAAEDVLGVNDLDDYRRFQDLLAAKGARKVAIIGAGLIGCEFTNDLLNGGFTVEAVDPMGWCLPTLLFWTRCPTASCARAMPRWQNTGCLAMPTFLNGWRRMALMC